MLDRPPPRSSLALHTSLEVPPGRLLAMTPIVGGSGGKRPDATASLHDFARKMRGAIFGESVRGTGGCSFGVIIRGRWTFKGHFGWIWYG